MTQRNPSPARSVAAHRVLQARNGPGQAARRSPMDRAWSLGYMAVSLLTISMACAVASGEAAKAELRFAAVSLHAAALPWDVCSAGAGGGTSAGKQRCASAGAHRSSGSGVC
ncbi:hypothetical protein QFZ42_002387 [Variovorax paradoxus]|uniref:hypothetical protein n=1 Tax=Variovorax paradoxus TaxID=34073 RepID=UPI002790DDA1|nr:hypothetical protein [Variovorax paradoxus]MDQ0570553.1 hypothetical protein [Variovorax paradoxus]